MRKTTVALIALAGAWQASAAIAQEYPTMNLRLGHTYAPTTVQSQIDQWFVDEIEKRSGGKIKIRIFWSEALGKNVEMLDLIGSGAMELGIIVPSFFPTRLPLSSITNALPLAFDSSKQAQIIQTELVAKIPEIQEEYRRNKVWPIFSHGLGVFRLQCVKPLATVADLKNLRIRSYGEHVPKLWGAFGAVGVTALPPEIYEGLQRGKLDCAYFPTDLAHSFKLHEVAKYWSTANFGALSTWPILVNYDTWHNKWPENVKKLIMDVAHEATKRDHQLVDAVEKESLEAMRKQGGLQVVEFKEQKKLEETAPNFFAAWTESMKAKSQGDVAQRIVDLWRKRRGELKE
jgi:TRAP-type C4-dicarboxylate transport system substrate-binding protein